ncbi:MAG TPA: metal-dependent hydrolase [Candidatus Bathyarchaeia archaeon]|nr:metal-dependent hydrolase [Candidatus Bathyarchaeia archaeon]
MNLTTHFFFGVAVGFLFFGHPEIALLVALGALLPDFDREYWFMPSVKYRDEQLHRSLFHNMFVMGAVYLLSPFVSLGMFLHVFQDSFTTIKDRGCEWLYPVTRLVKRGLKNANGKDEPLDSKERVYFYQEDPKGLLENADPDLREVGDRPVPWRRTYGPALNGKLLDQGFLIGSIAITLVWLFLQGSSNLTNLSNFFANHWVLFIVGYGSVALMFSAGELDRRDRAEPVKVPSLTFLKIPLLVAGLALSSYSIFLAQAEIMKNLEAVGHYWSSVLLAIIVGALISLILIKWHTRSKEKVATV